MRRNIFLFLLLISVFSCTKFGKNVTIKGKVLNPITGEGIPNVEVELLKTTAGLPGGNKGVKSTYTDANGNFEISKSGLGSYWLACRVSGDYYEIGWIENGINVTSSTGNLNVKKGKTMHVDFHAVTYGKLQRHIKNINCTSENDQIKIYYDGAEYNDNLYSIGLLTTLDGCIDITTTPLKISSGNKYFHWEVTKNGVTNTYYDTVFVQDTGITTLDIFY